MANITVADIVACLEDAQEELRNEVPRLNNGGCGVFALELSKRLDQLGITGYSIVIQCRGWYDGDIEEIRHNVKENGYDPLNVHDWYRNGFFIPHIVIQLGEYDIDGHDTMDSDSVEHFNGELFQYELEAFVKDRNAWNSAYDRGNDQYVCDVLDECFSLLDEPESVPEPVYKATQPFNPLVKLPDGVIDRQVEEIA